jgi:hypothetical protein
LKSQIYRVKTIQFIISFFLFSICLSVRAASDTNLPPCRVIFELRDGSRVVAQSNDKFIRFHSPLFGDLKLAVPDIRMVECVSTNSALLTTTKSDKLMVWFADSQLTAKTSFGKIQLSVIDIRKFTVSADGGNVRAHPPGLVALWSGEDSGNDFVGHHDAELTDITFADEKVGRAFSFNGHGSWANIPAARSVDLANADGLTIAAWIKPSDVNGFHPIMEWEVSRQKSACQFWIGRNPQNQGVLMGIIAGTDGSSREIFTPEGTLTAGLFQHIAFSYDKSTGNSRLFINGSVVAEKNIGTVTPDTTGPLFFGWRPCSQPEDSTYNRYFSGLLDEVAIYNRSLSPEEIRSICTEENNGELPPAPAPNRPVFRRGDFQSFPIGE